MLRIVRLAILPGMLLTACTACVFADTVRSGNMATIESKQMYSNRPAGYMVPTPYYGTPMAPRFVVPPTAVQHRSMVTVPRVNQTGATSVPVVPVQVQFPLAPQVVASQMITPQAVTPQAVAPQAVAPQADVPQPIERTLVLREPQPEVNVNDELDTFYARLAKIRLEQRQLPDALALIQKIKSETFRVRTVVGLAEYVSRDKNYQAEADRLFRLALAGMEALDRGQPFRVDPSFVPDVPKPPVAPPADTPAVDVAVPVAVPAVTPANPSVIVPTNPSVVTPADPPVVAPPRQQLLVPLDDPPVVKPPSASPDSPVTPRPPLVLPDGAGRNNGRHPPPPPPQGNGVDGGIVTSPPAIIPPVSTEAAPPAHTTETNGSTPLSPPDSLTTTPTQVAPPIVKPTPIPLEDEGVVPETPKTTPSQESEKPPQQPQPPTRRPPVIILDEN